MKLLAVVIVAATLSALTVACGGDDSGGTTTAPTTRAAAATSAAASASPATTPAASTAGTVVNVKLQEWSVLPATDSAPAGDVTFNIDNIGPEEEHEFVILKTDLTPAQLPTLSDGAVEEGASGITSPGEIEGIGAGAKATGSFNLTPGHYIFLCNLVDQKDGQVQAHFKEGMFTEFTVR